MRCETVGCARDSTVDGPQLGHRFPTLPILRGAPRSRQFELLRREKSAGLEGGLPLTEQADEYLAETFDVAVMISRMMKALTTGALLFRLYTCHVVSNIPLSLVGPPS